VIARLGAEHDRGSFHCGNAALADQVAIRAVEVDAIDDAAREFYVKFGFVPLLDDPRHLFLAMPTLRRLNLA
jgi:hypothetical protein